MRPCTRRSASAFCMSLRTSALHPQKRCRLLHVIAKHALAHVVTPLPSACHCEPRPCTRSHAATFCMSLRTSAWGPRKGAPFVGRGATRERCPALAFGRSWAWRTLGRRGAAIRVPCPGCPLRKRPYKRSHVPAFCMSLRASALHPQKRCRLLHVIANQCAHWCGNPRPLAET